VIAAALGGLGLLLLAVGAWLEAHDQRVRGYTLVTCRKVTRSSGSSSPSVYADAPSPASTPSPPNEA
jgi:hypothetical protein